MDRLGSLYKKSPPRRQLIDVNEIIGEMAVMLRGETTRFAVSIRTDLEANLPNRPCAVAASVDEPHAEWHGDERNGGVLTVRSKPEDGRVTISVSDTNVGLTRTRFSTRSLRVSRKAVAWALPLATRLSSRM